MNREFGHEIPANFTEGGETLQHGRPLHLVLVHNFELENGEPKITHDPERFQKLIENIAGKSEIVKVYTGTKKEDDAQSEKTQKTTEAIITALEERNKNIRSTLQREDLQRLPGTPEYYAYLADKSKESHPEFQELSMQQTLQATGNELYDLWMQFPDPRGEITTAEEMTVRFNHILSRFKKVAERSPAEWPEATLILIVDKAIQAWLFDQTGVSTKEMGVIRDDEPIEMTFSGEPDEQPTFTFKDRTYPIDLEKLGAKDE